jgi:hypothetical protein
MPVHVYMSTDDTDVAPALNLSDWIRSKLSQRLEQAVNLPGLYIDPDSSGCRYFNAQHNTFCEQNGVHITAFQCATE